MKRCPFKANLNKQYTATFRDTDFHFFFIPEENSDGSYSLIRGSMTPAFEWAVYDTLNHNTQYTDEEKDKVINLVFDGVLQQTFTDELYDEYRQLLRLNISTKEEAITLSKSFYKKYIEHYCETLFKKGLQKRKVLILDVIYKVMNLHMPNFVYVK